MDLFLSICQAIGLAIAIGVGGTLVPVVAATLAHVDVGLDVAGTDWEFVAENWFILVLFAVVVVELLVRRRKVGLRVPLLLYLTAAGALFGAASLAERGEPAVAGLLVGCLVALVAVAVAGAVLEGAQRRVAAGGEESGPANALILLFAAAGAGIAVASVLLPPVGLVALLALAVLAIRRRQRAGEKYEGLRILR